MKSQLLLGLFALAGLVSAQDSVKGLPECAITCVNTAITSTGCQPIDVKCFCEAHEFHQGIAPCIESSCDTSDQEQTELYARGVCSVVGVELPSFEALLVERAAQVTAETEGGAVVSATPTGNPSSTASGTTTETTTTNESTGMPMATVSASASGNGTSTSDAGVNIQHGVNAAVTASVILSLIMLLI